MKVRDIMTKNVVYVNPNTTVTEAAQVMQKHNVGSIPVCDQNGVVGIVTDRDIVVRNVAHAKNPQSTIVKDVMTSLVQTIGPDIEGDDASRKMAELKVRRLPVVENNKLIGMVALGDFATAPQFSMEVSEALGDISRPSKPEGM